MQLTPEQQQAATKWIADGLKLSDVQKRLETDFGIRLTYMETRLLVDDLKIVPKDPERPKTPPPTSPIVSSATSTAPATVPAPGAPAQGPKVSVTVDTVTQPGTLVSGKVTFSDGQKATWFMDQYGRPGMVADTKGYRPAKEDMEEFNLLLDRELTRLGL
jgi:hypothetical protein